MRFFLISDKSLLISVFYFISFRVYQNLLAKLRVSTVNNQQCNYNYIIMKVLAPTVYIYSNMTASRLRFYRKTD